MAAKLASSSSNISSNKQTFINGTFCLFCICVCFFVRAGRVTRVTARATRIVRFVKLVRIVRVGKLYKHAFENINRRVMKILQQDKENGLIFLESFLGLI